MSDGDSDHTECTMPNHTDYIIYTMFYPTDNTIAMLYLTDY